MPKRKQVEDDLITVQEGATLKGVSRARIHQWIKAGRLKTETKYGRVLIHRPELMALQSLRRGRPPKSLG
ncbi:MAG: helix-turn-helix domain-containing protein [Blastocatellia bacterium]